jgi:hypothetical protein
MVRLRQLWRWRGWRSRWLIRRRGSWFGRTGRLLGWLRTAGRVDTNPWVKNACCGGRNPRGGSHRGGEQAADYEAGRAGTDRGADKLAACGKPDAPSTRLADVDVGGNMLVGVLGVNGCAGHAFLQSGARRIQGILSARAMGCRLKPQTRRTLQTACYCIDRVTPPSETVRYRDDARPTIPVARMLSHGGSPEANLRPAWDFLS